MAQGAEDDRLRSLICALLMHAVFLASLSTGKVKSTKKSTQSLNAVFVERVFNDE